MSMFYLLNILNVIFFPGHPTSAHSSSEAVHIWFSSLQEKEEKMFKTVALLRPNYMSIQLYVFVSIGYMGLLESSQTVLS